MIFWQNYGSRIYSWQNYASSQPLFFFDCAHLTRVGSGKTMLPAVAKLWVKLHKCNFTHKVAALDTLCFQVVYFENGTKQKCDLERGGKSEGWITSNDQISSILD